MCDSTYVVNCFRDRWYAKWEGNGWRNATKQPVANADLWRPLVELVTSPRRVRSAGSRVTATTGSTTLVDRLAVAAIPRPR